ncbi:MAG: DUF1492 domain-containing protein [Acidaminococcus intestini]
MNVKEYLEQGLYLDKEINSQLLEVTNLRSLAQSLSSTGFEEHHNPNRPTEASFTKILEKVWEREEHINSQIDHLVDLKQEISKTIDKVEDPKERLVLRYRYIHFLKWDRVAAMVGISRRQVFVVHKEALLSVEKILGTVH